MQGLVSINEAMPHIVLLHDIRWLFTISMGALSGKATVCAIVAFHHCSNGVEAVPYHEGEKYRSFSTRCSCCRQGHLPTEPQTDMASKQRLTRKSGGTS